MHLRRTAGLLAGTFAFGVSACASQGPQRGEFNDGMRPPPLPALFVSPAGKPYRAEPRGRPAEPPPDRIAGPPPTGANGPPRGPSPMEQWFAEADINADGALDIVEFRQDFADAFAEFDLDDSGDISGTEITHYEMEIFPEISSTQPTRGNRGGRSEGSAGGRRGPPGGGGGPPGGRSGGSGQQSGGRSSGGGRSTPYQAGGAARYGLLAIHHPLLQADTDINRRITPEEFTAAANLRFGLLDTDNDGSVTAAQLEAMLPQRSPPRRR